MPQSILGNTFIATVGRIANTLLGVAAIGIVSRLLGVSQYGVYVLLFSYGTLLQIAADFGLYLALTKSLAAHSHDHSTLLGHTAGLRLGLLAVFFSTGIAVAFFVAPLRPHLIPLLIVAGGLSFQSLSQLIMSVFQYHAVIWRATISDLAGRIIQILGLLLVVYLHPARLLEAAVLWFTAGTVTTYVVNRMLLPAANTLAPRFSWVIWKKIIQEAWPYALLLLLNVIYFRIDVIMLSLLRTPREVGWYGLAYRIIESGLFFPAMVGGLLLPRLIIAFKAGKSHTIRVLLRQTTHLMLIIGGLILIVLIKEAPGIVTFIAGPSFAPAGPLLAILSLALAVMLCGNVAGFALVAFDRQRFLVALYGVLVIVNIIGNFLLIPLYGAAGAAWMTVATEVLSMLTASYLIWRQYSYIPHGWFFLRVAVVAAAVVLAWAVLPGSWHVAGRIMAGSVLYVILAASVGLFSRRYFQALIASPV